MHSIAGGVFPFPLSVTELVKRLPPPNAFEGPFVKIDEFIKRFQHIELSEEFQPNYVYINGEPMKELENLLNPFTLVSTSTSNMNSKSATGTVKRSIILARIVMMKSQRKLKQLKWTFISKDNTKS